MERENSKNIEILRVRTLKLLELIDDWKGHFTLTISVADCTIDPIYSLKFRKLSELSRFCPDTKNFTTFLFFHD